MKISQVKELAVQRGVKTGRLSKRDLIRTMQQAEANDPCFDSGKVETCGQDGCLWREDCN